jgi:hypothetical protein
MRLIKVVCNRNCSFIYGEEAADEIY